MAPEIDRKSDRTVSNRPFHYARTVTALVALAVGNIGAQDSTALQRPHWMVGGSLGVIGFAGGPASADFTLIGIHFTQLKPGRLGADVSINVMPRLLTVGALTGAARVGVALPVAVASGMLLLPSAGVTLVGGAGQGGAGGTAGVNVGGAAVLGTGRVGLRTGLTWHRIKDVGSVWLLELGLVKRRIGK
ncbi:hypothetical protein [Gemmatimonas sp.]|uniref:hypothetical protein n=1 Tax=Gemmatimonas sp. TaxID=1962908 RepID=UPI0039838869